MTTTTREDSWQNIITGLGRARDKRTSTEISEPVNQSSGYEFDALYSGDHTAAKIARLPAREMVREWITLKVEDGESEGLKGAESAEEKMSTAKDVMQALGTLGVKAAFGEALLWARVHGGAMIYLGVDDGVEALAEPLNLDSLRELKSLTVFNRWEVPIHSLYTTEESLKDGNFGEPEFFQLHPHGSALPASLAAPIHESRFIRFDGVPTSRRRIANNGGWCDSVYTAMHASLRDYGASWGSIAHLFQDFSQAVLKMQGLAMALASSEGDVVLDRMATMDMCRSVARAIPIDAESEDFIRVATPMSGLPETIDRFMLRISSAAEIPATLLFGQSPSGLNATGDSDVRFFYDGIKSDQEEKLRSPLDRLFEVLFAAKKGPTKGVEPEGWSYEFNPLWQSTDLERAKTRETQSKADSTYIADGVLDPDEVAMSRFGGDSYSTDTVLDMERRLMEPEEPEEPEVVEVPVAAPVARPVVPVKGKK